MRSGSWLWGLLGTSLTDALSLEKRETPAVFNVPLKHKQVAKSSIESFFTITGKFVTDTLVIGDTTVKSMKIGILNVYATQNTLSLGEANSSFISLTKALVAAKTIKSPAFRDSQDEKPGVLIFGGVNKAKYNGTLHTLPIVNNPADDRKTFRVNMTSFSINETLVFPKGLSTQALHDSLVSYTSVPESIAQEISSQLGTYVLMFGPMHIPCNTTSSDTTLTFKFGVASFKLDIGLFIETGSVLNDEDICYLGIVAVETDAKDAKSVVLGANFLPIDLHYIILEITTGMNAVTGAKLEQDDADDTGAKDDSEKEKSVGFRIDVGAGLRLSISIFVIWALFCL
ncbi:hypothetical protein N7517_001921 [Penicillium concentricum]|uniref:Peptidase A1 domain-containing protein n=1 Tax=Penicillium concentricum TaxID=293559 RepID=A0A9W9VL66_9EURO|nr:uncharacterized protein N7517_001921 [Penicillium concentricum]KAJ5384010.1 hypothetical protein N7517_001921 [Penicillium concentricum]